MMRSSAHVSAAFLLASSPLPPRLPGKDSHTQRTRSKFLRVQKINFAIIPCACATPPTDQAKQYVPLHVHSDFSLLDGASQLPSLVERAAELGVPALALTDHGVLYGAIQLVRLCAGTDVKPIIGNEMYIVNNVPGPPIDPTAPFPKRYHLIVLAKNTQGYRNLVKLTSMAHLDGKVGKGIFARPCINKAQLYQYREGLIVSSACLGGEIAQAILNDDMEMARTVAMWFRDTFGDDFYLEIQDHGSEEDKKVNPVMVQLSKELGIKVIATNDSHFTNCLDAEAHDALICIQTGKLLTDENRLHYAGNEYFKSIEEMRKCFVDHLPPDAVDEALYNTLEVAKKVDPYDLFGETRIPDFPVPREFHGSTDEYLRHVAHESLGDRLGARIRASLVDTAAEEHYFEVLRHELDMICQMGFSSYFLVVWDYIRYAKELGIPVGPGRGSAAGSLVAFSLRITDVDPIQFNLLFERFLNPERKSMPDIDTDFSVEGRERVIKYVSERYGPDRVAQIITFNRLTSKAVLKDVARVHSVPYAEADRLAKLIPVVRGKPATLTKLLSKDTPSPDFKTTIDANPPYRIWLEKAKRIEGANKTYGIHAAGVVISASPLTDVVPLSRAKHGETITQYAMEDVEALGLLKMDFLGLKNLTVIESALKFINEGRRHLGIETDLEFSVDTLPLDDEKTYKLLMEGELDGIFQLDASAGMRSIVRELRPSSLEDISSILALYRPGPLDAGLIPKFIRRKHGIDPIEYDHPLLEPILRETYGIMVYQEQIMRIARDLAGYSLGQADILRRAMGKKKIQDMEREKPRFVKGAVKRGLSEEKAGGLFDQMTKFAEYCFNKSHSTAYAYLTYQTAYLKANFPVEYSAALLRSNMAQSEKLVRYLADANMLGVRVLPPSVNKSDLGFSVDRSDRKEPVVLFGLEAVKTVGASVSEALLVERKARGSFRNIIDLIERVNLRVLNKRALAALIQAGAFDELHSNRRVLLNRFDSLLALRRKLRDRRKRQETKGLSDDDTEKLTESERLAWEEAEIQLARDSENEPDFPTLERLAGEKASIGFYASGHPLYELQEVVQTLGCTKVSNIIGISEARDKEETTEDFALAATIADGTDVMILSCITDLKMITTAKGKKMAKWIIEDATNRIPGIVFPSNYEIMAQPKCEPTMLSQTGLEEKAAETGKSDPVVKNSLVVEEDARVVVWGKVDRESSGTSQVIIDDVQRVDDVHAIVATVPYDRTRPASTQVQIVRHIAADVLQVDLSSPKQGTYKDANGEIRKRRWTKSKPLALRNRLPLVVHCFDAHGKRFSSVYAGNTLRFPIECQELLHHMKERTGFEFKLVSGVGDFAMQGVLHTVNPIRPSNLVQQQRDVDIGAQADADMVQISESIGDPHTPCTLRNQNEVSLSRAERELSPIQSLNLQDLSPNPSYATQPCDPEQDAVLPSLDAISGDRGLGKGRESTANTSQLTNVEGVLLTEDERALYEMEYSRFTTREVLGEKTKIEAALHAVRNPPFHKDSFYNDTFKKPPSLQTFSVHDDFRAWQDNAVSVISRPSFEVGIAKHSITSRDEVTSAYEDGHRSSEAAVGEVQGTEVRDVIYSEQNSGTPTGKWGSPNWQHPDRSRGEHDSNFSLNVRSHVNPVESQAVEQGQDRSKVVICETKLSSRGEGVVDAEQAAMVAIAEDHVQKDSIESSGSAVLNGSGYDVGIASRWASTSEGKNVGKGRGSCSTTDEEATIELSDGLVVDFDSVQTAGVLDAVCLVAGHVTGNHARCKSTICAMTEVDLTKLVETNVSLRISADVVQSEAPFMFVLVTIRETRPTGKRKRTRSFGPVVVVYCTEKESSVIPPKTKKAQKMMEIVYRRLKEATVCETSDGSLVDEKKSKEKARRRTKSITSSRSGFVLAERWAMLCKGYPRIGDGGQVLRYMSRAAEHCVDRATGVLSGLRAVKLVSFVCDDSALLMLPAKSLRIRAHIDGKSFAGIRVQVQGNVSNPDQRSANLLATFIISDDGFKQLRSFSVVVDEEPLFAGAIVEACFSKYVHFIDHTRLNSYGPS